jgi:hypothetical protein
VVMGHARPLGLPTGGVFQKMAEEARLELASRLRRRFSKAVAYQLAVLLLAEATGVEPARRDRGASFPTRGACQCPTPPCEGWGSNPHFQRVHTPASSAHRDRPSG